MGTAMFDVGAKDAYLRGTLTDARVIHIPGPHEEAQKKADRLCDLLKAVLPATDVKVTRPVKCVSLRVSGLDDSVTKEDVFYAIKAVCQLTDGQAHLAEHIKASEVRFGTFGLGVCWVTCPVEVANLAMERGVMVNGWAQAQLRLMEPRVLRCFRCLEPGHVSQKCRSNIDRSGLCHRCAKPGHKAQECDGRAYCLVCAAAGKPAGHRVGNPACAAAKKPVRKRRGGVYHRDAPDAAPAAMETQEQSLIAPVPREENLASAPPNFLQGSSLGVPGSLAEGPAA